MKRACLIAIGLALAGCAQKPSAELFEARQAYATARDYEADIYAPDEYGFALSNLRSAEDEIERQDQSPPWSRNYSRALEQLELATEQFVESQEVASTVKEESYRIAEELIPGTRQALVAAEEEVARARRTGAAFTQMQNLDADLAIATDYFRSGQRSFDEGNYVAASDQLGAAMREAERIRQEAVRLADSSGR